MPHFTVEYSANLEVLVDIAALVRSLHRAALDTGVFELAAVRTRAEPRTVYAIADENPDNAFVAVVGRIARGRPDATRARVAQCLLDVLKDKLAAVYASRPLALSVEIQEIDPAGSVRHNNLHERMRAGATAGAPA